MYVSQGLAAAIAIGGNFFLSLGMVLQKRHIGWIGRSPKAHAAGVIAPDRRRDGRFYRDLGWWFVGFMLMNLVPAFNFIALMGLPTNVVGAAAGMSVAFTALLAKLMLKERLGKRRLAWTLLLFAAIAASGFLGEGGTSDAEGLSTSALFIFIGIPLLMGVLLFILRGRFKGPRHAAVLASVSGCLGGFMVFPLRALQIDTGPEAFSWFSSPYLYAYLVAGASSFVLIQAAYKDGEMSAVAPALYGMQVLWPALGSYFVFGAKFLPIQTGAFALVAICVAVIAGLHPAAKKPVALLGDGRSAGRRAP
jgi:drug/metabolite transporter (DMT)-like permease